MSFQWLLWLTIIEVVVLVAALAIYLVLLTRRLRSISRNLSKVAWGVRAVEVEVGAIEPAVGRINGLLRELTDGLLPGVAGKAADLAEGPRAHGARPTTGGTP